MQVYSSFSKYSQLYAFAAGLLCAINLPAAPDAQIAPTGERQVTISYRLADLKFQKFTINGESAEQPDFENAIPLNVAGVPELPTRVFIVGVPPGAQAEVSIVPGTAEERSEIYVPPVPVKERADDLTRWRYAPDAQIYSRDAFYPADLVRVDPPAQFRQQTIVRVQAMPVQYNPVRKQLRIYRDLQIVVRFVGGSPPTLARPSFAPSSKSAEEFYRDVLVNYDQAKTFRSSRTSKNTEETLGLFRSASPQIDGPLYKFAIRQEGIYRIAGQALANAGISLATVQPGTIHLYNNGGRELPRDIRRARPEGLVENAIYVSDGGDGQFDSNDFILFYGRGIEGFAYDSTSGQASHYINHFGFDNYYWLSFGGNAGIRMVERTPQPVAGLTPLTSFKDRLFVEEEREPVFESDQTWYGWLFTNAEVSRSRRYQIKLSDPLSEGTASMRFAFYSPYTGSSRYDSVYVKYGSQELAGWPIFGNNRNQIYSVDKAGGLANGDNEILLRFSGSGEASQLYIDYFELVYDRQLRLSDGMLIFDGRAVAGNTAYTLSNAGADASGLWLFDVSDFSRVARLSTQNRQVNGTQVTFADAGVAGNLPRRYLAATSTGFKSIGAITRDEVSNWRTPDHDADMIIITHEDFLSINPATGKDQGPLAKFVSLRENYNPNDALKTVVVKIQDVFDEFSCGMYDPVAIRDFLKYAFENWNGQRPPPAFVMLVGDGDYDPKNINNKTDKNWIPTFHTPTLSESPAEALDEIGNRVTDSWFTYLSDTGDEVMDMAIGRIPARSLADVETYVDKIIRYETKPAFGPWRNTMVMVADDEYGEGVVPEPWESEHIYDTETLVNTRTPGYFDVKKIYETEYPAVQYASISGIRKPAATEALLRLINNGALVVNYAGHGAPNLLSHERILESAPDFERIQNGDRQALWIVATCSFGKFDLPLSQSFAEELILARGRGAIAALATARLVYAPPNGVLNQQYYRFLFGNNGQISARIGAAMASARIQTGDTVNDEKFHVLGDPSLRIAIPRYSASMPSVTPDTIKALGVMTVRGKVQRDGVDWPDFNGAVRLEALDSRREVNYHSPGGFDIPYSLPGNSLFRGEAPVKNGAFTVQFFVPKDITYGGAAGRLNLYFTDNKFDGNGFRDNLPVGGTSGSIVDRAGPRINIGFAGVDNFQPGDVVGPNPALHAVLSDSLSGINITGEIGHKIMLALDGQTDNKIDVTDLFNYDSGSFMRGSIVYALGDLAEGRHTVEIKAWDNLNNSNTAVAEFVIRPQDRLILIDVMNYPNPCRGRTTFTFEVNLDDTEVRVKIFTLSGRLIRTLEQAGRRGFNQIEWDGLDADGDELANGVYLYKVIATQRQSGEVLRAEEIGKLAVQR